MTKLNGQNLDNYMSRTQGEVIKLLADKANTCLENIYFNQKQESS